MSFFGKVHESVLRKFILHNVDYVLIGGHAAIFHGVRRTTSDMDFLVRPTLENGAKILKAFEDLQVFSFGMDPDSVDILTFSRGVPLAAVFDNVTNARIDDLTVRVIDIHDLLKNKENLANQSEEKNLVDQQDILALRRILKSR